jgi:hypothetical protein
VEEAVEVLRDVATGLADIDGAIVHRDVKPQSILLYEGAWLISAFRDTRRQPLQKTLETTFSFGHTLRQNNGYCNVPLRPRMCTH